MGVKVGMFQEDVEVNEFYCNKAIHGHIQPDEVMKEYGFRNDEDKWYFYRQLDKKADIEMTISIYKDNPYERINISVIDDSFGQYYDYQRILRNTPTHSFAYSIFEKVEDIMTKLQNVGIISGHIYGEYI